MRCKKTMALLLVAALLMSTAMPLLAWDGGNDLYDNIDHPWQDDGDGNGGCVFNTRVIVVVVPIVITVRIPLPVFFTNEVDNGNSTVDKVAKKKMQKPSLRKAARFSGRNEIR
ncbi:MAG: hypothetical protein KAT58_04740 [candidate division Zixibacteria bacterium]|nr:hypothetical protein [candidate division Zixibacteria bacterium]